MSTIVEFCTPPVPGETHKYYGDAHNSLIKLPGFQLAPPSPPPPVVTSAASRQASTRTIDRAPAPAPMPMAVEASVASVASATVAVTAATTASTPIVPVPVTPSPSQPVAAAAKRPSNDRTLHDLAAAGNVLVLKQVLLLLPDPLKAVNDAQGATGYTPLHYAAARGHIEVVQCLLDDYAVSVDARDKEGETPLLKAAYNGHYGTVKFLLGKKANIHQKDKDGWTALHNACARGNLHIVRLLIHHGARVDVKSKMGHTPLMNAASKGFISIVEYLLDEAHANPLIKNNNGEAAYDASAASGEAYVCELLEKGGKKWWHTQRSQGGASVYDVVQYHVSVVVILHENQRATSLLGLSRPQFGPGALTKQDVRGPWSLHPSGTPSRKDAVTLPRATDEHSANWCWMTEWDMDLRDPRVDPTSGWQYARSFDVPDDQWTPVAPTSGAGWVRRRRWVRVMNRQASFNGTMAVPQTDYLARADDLLATLDTFVADDNDDQTRIRALTNELRVYEESMQLLRAGVKDDLNPYRKERANQQIQVHAVRIEALNTEIGRLAPQLATPISSVPYNAELARELGFSSSPQGSSGSGGGGGAMSRSHSTSAHDTHGDNDMDDDDDNDHHHAASSKRNRYPTDGGNAQDLDSNPWSVGDRSSLLGKQQRPFTLDDDQSSASSLLQHIHFDTNPHAATTRVYSHSNSNRGAHNGVWESDADVKECRRCSKRFGLLNRRHHCRRCGLIVCDKCSSSRAILAATEIVQNPVGKIASHVLEAQYQRICDKCYADLGISS